MVTRIATNFQNQNTLRNLQLANQNMSLSTYQITTGLKSQRISDNATESSQVLTLRDVQTRTGTYLDNLTSASNTLAATESALQQMTDLLSDANNTATLGRNENSAATRAALAPKAQSIAESFYTLFKTQFNGQYLFSGSDGAQPPINGNAAAAPFPGSPIPTTWYQGDSQLPSVVSGPGTTLSYGVLGNNPAFAQIKAGLESLWYGLQTNNVTEIDNATATLNQAKTSLSGVLGQVGGQINTADLIKDRQSSLQKFTSSQLDELEKVDVSAALTQFSQQQTTLQASMLTISKINQLTLLDYLR